MTSQMPDETYIVLSIWPTAALQEWRQHVQNKPIWRNKYLTKYTYFVFDQPQHYKNKVHTVELANDVTNYYFVVDQRKNEWQNGVTNLTKSIFCAYIFYKTVGGFTVTNYLHIYTWYFSTYYENLQNVRLLLYTGI